MRELKQAAPVVAQRVGDLEFAAIQTVVRARGREPRLQRRRPRALRTDQLRNIADSRTSRSQTSRPMRFALEALRTQQPASGRPSRRASSTRRSPTRQRRDRVVLLAASLDDVLANVRLVRRSLLVAGAASLVVSWLAATCSRGGSRGGSAGSRRQPSDSPKATSRRPVVDEGRDEVGQLAARLRQHARSAGGARPRARESSSPMPRTS